MMVMPANNGKSVVHYWAGKYPGRIGHLYSPDGFRAPVPWLPYALDNGRFPAWSAGKAWDEDGYRRMLDRAAESGFSPRWALVPDVVADREGTLAEWDRWAALLSGYGSAGSTRSGGYGSAIWRARSRATGRAGSGGTRRSSPGWSGIWSGRPLRSPVTPTRPTCSGATP
jgi:hypothetical protein